MGPKAMQSPRRRMSPRSVALRVTADKYSFDKNAPPSASGSPLGTPRSEYCGDTPRLQPESTSPPLRARLTHSATCVTVLLALVLAVSFFGEPAVSRFDS